MKFVFTQSGNLGMSGRGVSASWRRRCVHFHGIETSIVGLFFETIAKVGLVRMPAERNHSQGSDTKRLIRVTNPKSLSLRL